MGDDLTHLDADGNPHMVDVGDKDISKRSATACSAVQLPEVCRKLISDGAETKKGNVLQVARLAGIMAAKECSRIIPLCHPLQISKIEVDIQFRDDHLYIEATVKCEGKTGVEMEALTSASVTALTIYDMLKALSHDMEIGPTRLLKKTGGKSGDIDLQ
ncbi:MAG: cyclic pyranopterin monophosphate synthase MoaC [Planctomycetes bacterium]|nr:cyclic pyranopterin monophosphate synthase MoaC [Planctomycetota bacterium]